MIVNIYQQHATKKINAWHHKLELTYNIKKITYHSNNIT